MRGSISAFEYVAFKQKVDDDLAEGRWIYRGQANTAWPLVSSYGRLCNAKSKPFDYAEFARLLAVFVDRASDWTESDLLTLNLGDRIALARHHGVPTPFLDWTESPYVAAFFALFQRGMRQSQEPFCVYALNVDEVERAAREPLWIDSSADFGTAQFGLLRTKVFQSRRIARQLGLFSYCQSLQPLDEYLAEQGAEDAIKRYCISVQSASSILRDLRLMGLTAGNLLDSLDGVAFDSVVAADGSG